MELVNEPGFSKRAPPRSAAGAEGRMWLLLWFLQKVKMCMHKHAVIMRRNSNTQVSFDSQREAFYRFLGWYGLAVKGAVADLKVGDPAKPLMNPGLVNGET